VIVALGKWFGSPINEMLKCVRCRIAGQDDA
jgi:hypothetical protein